MRLLRKEGDELIIVFKPEEKLEVGDTLVLREEEHAILAEVFEISPLDIPGVLAEVIRSEVLGRAAERKPSEWSEYHETVFNIQYARCKITAEIYKDPKTEKARIIGWTGYSPSRISKIEIIDESELMKLIHSSR